jgi:hypothetical protein
MAVRSRNWSLGTGTRQGPFFRLNSTFEVATYELKKLAMALVGESAGARQWETGLKKD